MNSLKTKVVNIRNYKGDYIYCGRGSIFGNPYEIGIDGTREEVINRYRKWINFLLRDDFFQKKLLTLRGKTLGCFCKPKACHCDVIKEHLDNYENNE